MTIQTPATTSPEIFSGIKALLAPATSYLNRDIQVQRLISEAHKLIQADAINGHLALAACYQLIGDVHEARHHLECASKLAPNNVSVDGSRAICLSNLGFFADAYDNYRLAIDPTRGLFSHYFPVGFVIGAFDAMSEAITQARKMEIPLENLEADKVLAAERILNTVGVSDADRLAILNIAGELMREHRLFFIGETPDVDVREIPGVDETVYITYRVGLEADAAADLTAELARRIAERIADIPIGFSVGFVGTSHGVN